MEKAFKGASPQEKERLVNEFLPLVKKIARGLARRSTDPVEDLIQVGSIGLLEAIERYETGHNTEFKTYAVHFITGHIRHYLRDRQNLLRGPRVLQELSYRLSQVTAKLTQEFGREPTNAELARALDVTPEQVDEVKLYDRRVTVLWLDQEGSEGEDDEQRSLLESLSDPRFSGEARDELDERLVLTEAMNRLPQSQRELLEMRYFQDLTQAELSRRLGISQMEVCRRLKKAEKQLRAVLTPPGRGGSNGGTSSLF
ncbi:MAG: sigma-70 family RNA polymerase sigma factor [Candidatus Sericytochromatia bacterium]|uniref:Sigma-70 family RNA polymerase sigma factor n=1 Tax=Candidatus Tanganyikabacteria bacterium TaxID=2961651 RepID=A0A938BM82_9BACT|nr:sigma-70 family RNA polymerase sigma factor [Candidatus Tanganyikabacteria bacterium]